MEGERPREPLTERGFSNPRRDDEPPRDPQEDATASDAQEPTQLPAWAQNLRDPAMFDPAKMDELKAEMEARVAQVAADTRQAIIDNANLDEAGIEQLDKVIDDLNAQMEVVSSKWADHVRQHGTLDADGRLRMMHDLSSLMVSVSDNMDAISPDWRGEGVDFTRLIRISSLEPFRLLRAESSGIHAIRGNE